MPFRTLIMVLAVLVFPFCAGCHEMMGGYYMMRATEVSLYPAEYLANKLGPQQGLSKSSTETSP